MVFIFVQEIPWVCREMERALCRCLPFFLNFICFVFFALWEVGQGERGVLMSDV